LPISWNENVSTRCGLPSSLTVKSFAVSPSTTLPDESRTTTSTETSVTPVDCSKRGVVVSRLLLLRRRLRRGRCGGRRLRGGLLRGRAASRHRREDEDAGEQHAQRGMATMAKHDVWFS
jgi:hypothetical protein